MTLQLTDELGPLSKFLDTTPGEVVELLQDPRFVDFITFNGIDVQNMPLEKARSMVMMLGDYPASTIATGWAYHNGMRASDLDEV